MTLFLSLVGGLYFTEGNSRCRVLKGLLQTFILCFFRVLVRGSVIPLIYGSVAYPSQGSEGSISSKNYLTNSSGLGVRSFFSLGFYCSRNNSFRVSI